MIDVSHDGDDRWSTLFAIRKFILFQDRIQVSCQDTVERDFLLFSRHSDAEFHTEEVGCIEVESGIDTSHDLITEHAFEDLLERESRFFREFFDSDGFTYGDRCFFGQCV